MTRAGSSITYPAYMSNKKNEILEQINSIREINGSFGSYDS